MKKVLYYITTFIFMFFIVGFCYAEKTLELNNPIISFKKIKHYSLQGFTTVNDYLFIILEGYDDTKSIIKVYDLRTNNEIISYDFPSLGHANDVTYNKNNNTIYVIHADGSNIIYKFDGSTFKYIERFESPLPIRSITYIEDTNEYAVRTVSVGFKYDSNFNLINKFPFVMGMNFGFDIGRQGWAYYKNHIYYTNWSWIKYGGDGSNSIYIYDYEGHRKDALYTDTTIGEIEDIAFYNNKMILGFNGYDGNYKFYMLDVPKVEEIVSVEDVEVVNVVTVESSNTIWLFLVFFSFITICFCIILKIKKSK